MTLDSGILKIKRKTVQPPMGEMPVETWNEIFTGYYGSRTVGYNRFWTAMQNLDRIDLLVRIQRFPASTEDRAVLTPMEADATGGTYNILQVQHLEDEDGLPVTDLTLQRMEGVHEPN